MYLRPLLCLICMFMLVNNAGAAPFAYVTNAGNIENPGNVSVIDTSNNTVLSTPVTINNSTNAYPYSVAVAKNGKRVYVGNQIAKTITVIDATTTDNNVLATVTLPVRPSALAVNAAGTRLYVAQETSMGLLVLDTDVILSGATSASPKSVALADTGVQVGSVTVGNYPGGVAVTPAGDKVYVSNAGDDTVTVVSANDVSNTYTVSGSPIAVGGYPRGVAINPAGTKVYVANMNANTVSIISTTGDTVTNTVATGASPTGITVASDGKVYVANSSSNPGSVTVIAADDSASTLTTSAGVAPFGVGVTPNGATLYVTNSQTPLDDPNGTVKAISTANGSVQATLNVGINPMAYGDFVGPVMYPITVTQPTGGSITVANASGLGSDGKIYVKSGDASPTFTITPSSGFALYSIDQVGGDPKASPVSTGDTYSFAAVTQASTLSATMKHLWTITYGVQPVGAGTVSCTPATSTGSNTYSAWDGATVTCTATVTGNYAFSTWSGCDSTSTNTCTLTSIAADRSISAGFIVQAGGPVKRGNNYHATIADAFANAVNGDVLKVKNKDLYNTAEDVTFNKPGVSITLEGSYDATQSSTAPSNPTHLSKLTIATGTVEVRNIAIY